MQRGTLTRALIAAGLLLAVFALGSWWVADPSPPAPLDAYVRQGRENGAAALRRDLLAAYPPLTPVTPLLQRMRELGLRCDPAPEGRAAMQCTARLRGYGREVTRVDVMFGMTADRVASLDAVITSQTQP